MVTNFYFFTVKKNTPEIVINSLAIENQMNFLNRDSSIVQVAEYLREDVTQYCNNLPELNWPPSVEELTADNRLPPTSVSLFLTNLMKSKKHNISRLIYSFSAEFIHGVIKQVLWDIA